MGDVKKIEEGLELVRAAEKRFQKMSLASPVSMSESHEPEVKDQGLVTPTPVWKHRECLWSRQKLGHLRGLFTALQHVDDPRARAEICGVGMDIVDQIDQQISQIPLAGSMNHSTI